MARRPAYAVSWERHRACTQCGRRVSEGQTAGMDLRYGFRWCERCFQAVERQRAAFRMLTLARTAVLSGAA